MRVKSLLLSSLTATGILFGGVAQATATPPNFPRAWPTDCNFVVQTFSNTAAYCGEHNGGSFHAIAVCRDNETGRTIHRDGRWRQIGASYAYCQGSEIAISAGINSSPENHTARGEAS